MCSEDDITLYFYIAGPTKKSDGAFGFVKWELKRRNFITSRDMVSVTSNNSDTNCSTLFLDLQWTLWRSFLQTLYALSITFTFTKLHVSKSSSLQKRNVLELQNHAA